jgi:hypothetical protein
VPRSDVRPTEGQSPRLTPSPAPFRSSWGHAVGWPLPKQRLAEKLVTSGWSASGSDRPSSCLDRSRHRCIDSRMAWPGM